MLNFFCFAVVEHLQVSAELIPYQISRLLTAILYIYHRIWNYSRKIQNYSRMHDYSEKFIPTQIAYYSSRRLSYPTPTSTVPADSRSRLRM